MEAASQETVTLASKLDDQGNPYLADCTLHTGWGAIVFKNGRATDVPVNVARQLVELRADVDVLGGLPEVREAVPPAQELEPPEPEPGEPVEPAPPGDPSPDSETEQQRLAREHLAADAAEDPDRAPAPTAAQHAKVIPPGFEPLTAEGELRCLAAKGDGSQCSNAAKAPENPDACGMTAHQEQVAQLQDAPE